MKREDILAQVSAIQARIDFWINNGNPEKIIEDLNDKLMEYQILLASTKEKEGN